MLWTEETPYHRLGVSPDVDQKVIRQAYTSQRRYLRGEERRLLYEIHRELLAPDKRALVDAFLPQTVFSDDSAESFIAELITGQDDPQEEKWFDWIDEKALLRQEASKLVGLIVAKVWLQHAIVDSLARPLPTPDTQSATSPSFEPLPTGIEQYLPQATTTKQGRAYRGARVGIPIFVATLVLILIFGYGWFDTSILSFQDPASGSATSDTQANLVVEHEQAAPSPPAVSDDVALSTEATRHAALVEATAPVSTPTTAPPRVQTTTYTNVRNGPGTEYQILETLEPGEERQVVARHPTLEWWHIVREDGMLGWIYAPIVQTIGSVEAVPVATDLPPPIQ